MNWWQAPAPSPDARALNAARERQSQLTKPPGSLGRLEELAVQLAAWQGVTTPSLERVSIAVFAADHGVVEEGVSAFPAAVTCEMLRNFARGGAAIAVLARELGAELYVLNVGALNDVDEPGVQNCRLAAGSANFCQAPAMSPEILLGCLESGRAHARRCAERGAQLFIGGEMGIGNTTAASALAAVLLDVPALSLAGPGTGLTSDGVRHKAAVIERAIALHAPAIDGPLEALRRLGGLEVAALAGAILGAAQRRLPVLVDGFIVSVAALVAVRLNPSVAEWLLLSHASAEPGHRAVVEALGQVPLLDLGLRLGEGSGAAVAVPLLRLACVLHARMATFADAGISGAL